MAGEDASEKLLRIIQEIAEGRYSNEIMGLTTEDTPEPIRTVAEAMGLMMVKVEAREFRLEQLIEQIKKNTIATVAAMAHALGARDSYTEGHAARVSEWGAAIAERLGMVEQEVEYVRLGGLLHDIGKIGFPDALFDTHGKQNPPELIKQIVRHPAIGANILSGLDFLGPALDYVRDHHERLDGSGYPRNKKDGEISKGAQILAVADGYDAMTTDRPYQKGKSPDTALGILRKQTPHRLSPEIVECFAEILNEKGMLTEEG